MWQRGRSFGIAGSAGSRCDRLGGYSVSRHRLLISNWRRMAGYVPRRGGDPGNLTDIVSEGVRDTVSKQPIIQPFDVDVGIFVASINKLRQYISVIAFKVRRSTA